MSVINKITKGDALQSGSGQHRGYFCVINTYNNPLIDIEAVIN